MGSCPFVLADGGDKVRGPAGCGEARIVAGPVTDCAYGTTYFSVDRVLPLSECQEGMPAIRQAALDRMVSLTGTNSLLSEAEGGANAPPISRTITGATTRT